MPDVDPFAPDQDETWDVTVPGVPEGKYPAYLSGIKRDFSKSSGNPMFVLTFTIAEGPHAGEDQSPYFVPDTKESKWKVIQTFEALGVRMASGEPVKISKSEMLRRGAVIEVKNDTWEGRTRLKVVGVYPHPQGAGYKYEATVAAPEPTASSTTKNGQPPAGSPAATTRPPTSEPGFKQQELETDGEGDLLGLN